ncbi:hypothetical protein BGX34_005533 [Mortierella sp. NVP85]|nr:hypothetical protein BGX34_005533 [Mortierella sp. NVP85]
MPYPRAASDTFQNRNNDSLQPAHSHQSTRRRSQTEGARQEQVTEVQPLTKGPAASSNGTAQDVERWDDAYEFGTSHSFEQVLDQLHHHFPRSPLSDNSDQSDYFQQASPQPLFKGNTTAKSRRASYSSYTYALPSPPTTTTATTLMSSRGTQCLINERGSGSQGAMKRLVGSTDSLLKLDPRSSSTQRADSSSKNNNRDNGRLNRGKGDALPPLLPPFASFIANVEKSGEIDTSVKDTDNSAASTPTSSSSSSLRALTASVTAPSTVAPSTGSRLHKERDDDELVLSTKPMTTITQEMMLSDLPTYTGIITRINPIKRVEAWVDDLEDLEVPEEDLDFNQVRSILAKSSSSPETLESVDNWDTSSENSAARSDDLPNSESPSRMVSSRSDSIQPHSARSPVLTAGIFRPGARSNTESANPGVQASETIETLDDDFDLPEDLESLRMRLQSRQHQQQRQTGSTSNNPSDKRGSLQQWQDSGSETDDFDFGTPMDNHSLSSGASLSRNSMAEDDEDFFEGLVFPENFEALKLVTNRPHRSETEPSLFGKESRFQDEQDDFWEGLEVEDDDAFHRKSRNRNLVVRPVPHGRERSASRVQRVVVPLKDFEALPSKIPRLSRAPGDNTRPVAAPSLSRTHSTHLELPLRGLQSKSSLPRLKRPSIVRRDGTRSSLILQTANTAAASTVANGTQPPSPTSSQVHEIKRNPSLSNRGDLPNHRPSSHAIRAVTFTEPADTIQPGGSASHPQQQVLTPEQPVTPGTGKSFLGLRTLARKFDFARPRFSARGFIPLFQPTFAAEQNPKPLEASKPAEPVSTEGPESSTKPTLLRPSYSRSSSFTELGTILASTETTKESLSSSRAGLVALADISEIPTLGESMTPVASADKFSRRLILKRSPKHSTFGDGSELDQFDNLPTFGVQVEDRLRATQAAAQARKQSTDRVAAWLRKPQSVANFKDLQKAEAKETESEASTSSRIRKTKSIRKSIFDIFGQSTTAEQPVKQEKQEKEKKKKKKKKANSNGPTLIRDLSQSRVRNVSGMVYNPQDKMWNGNDDILDEFEEDENPTSPLNLPSPMSSHSYSLHSPLMSASRPALISNMNQCLGQRTQVSGRMIFDPVKMCWMVNPEYISRRRQRRKDEHQPQGSMDEKWGDEPDIFAGLSDCEKEQDEEDKVSNRGDGDRTAGINSLSRSRSQRLISRPSFQRTASQELLAEEERLQAWAETMKPRASHEAGDSRPGSMGPHSIIPKGSRKSLNGLGCWNGFGGGGYSSRGEFEVGVEFDITDAFLEQCINVEAQHRKEAGRFFALPCTQTAPDVRAPKTSRLSRMASSKVLSLGRKSGKSKRPADEHVEGLEQHVDNGSEKQKTKEQARKDTAEDKRKEKEETKKDKGKEKQKAKEESPANAEMEEVKKTRGMPFPINPLRSWPPRNKSKSKSIVAQLLSSDGAVADSPSAESSIKPKPSILKSTESGKDGSDIGSTSTSTSNNRGNSNNGSSDSNKTSNKTSNKSKNKSKTIGKSGLLQFTSYSTSSAAPAAVTLAARGRGGSRDVSFHQLPSKHDSVRGTLSFAATLAVARRGTYDRRRIGDNTFDPLNHSRSIDGEPALNKDKEDKMSNSGKEIEDDDNLERGYRVTSKARGRPPMRAREELILEFERHAGRRFR